MSSVDEQLVVEIEQVPVDVDAGRRAVRARHRRRTVGAAIVLAVVAVAAVVGVAVVRAGDDRDQPVVTGPGPTVTGAGFPPSGITVTLSVCLDAVKLASCDSARPTLVAVDENHGFAVSMRLYRDVLDNQWTRFFACVLRMDWQPGGVDQEPIVLPISFDPADDPGPGLRPQLRLDQADHVVTVGVPFTVEATNLQIGQGYDIGMCPSPSSGEAWELRCDLAQLAHGSADGEGRLRLTTSVGAERAPVCPAGTPCGLAVGGVYLDDPLLVMVPIDLRSR